MRHYRTLLLLATLTVLVAIPFVASAQLPAMGTRIHMPEATQKALAAPTHSAVTSPVVTAATAAAITPAPTTKREASVSTGNLEPRLQVLEEYNQDIQNWQRRWGQGALIWGFLWWIPWIVFSWQWWRRRFWVFAWPAPWWWWIPWLWFIPWFFWGWWWAPVWWGWWSWLWWWLPWIFWLPWWFVVIKHVLQWLETKKP